MQSPFLAIRSGGFTVGDRLGIPVPTITSVNDNFQHFSFSKKTYSDFLKHFADICGPLVTTDPHILTATAAAHFRLLRVLVSGLQRARGSAIYSCGFVKTSVAYLRIIAKINSDCLKPRPQPCVLNDPPRVQRWLEYHHVRIPDA